GLQRRREVGLLVPRGHDERHARPHGRGRGSQRAQNLLDLITRQALHAKTIGFIHPKTKQTVKFDSELPEDMKQVLEKLG
ncbi:MAG: hypothetical protein L0287_34775, partial [Anaerolineae bacterium]|nr:hypothetical protein [Anaerolineae bacterium]